jgi:hypothetical protein
MLALAGIGVKAPKDRARTESNLSDFLGCNIFIAQM